jgi:hypothetical protein
LIGFEDFVGGAPLLELDELFAVDIGGVEMESH